MMQEESGIRTRTRHTKRIVSAVFGVGVVTILLMVALLAPFLFPWRTQAGTTWTVTTLIDDVNDGTCAAHCSIRDAIAASSAGDTIIFGVGGTLTIGSGTGSGEFVLPSGVIIDGTGVSINGGGTTRIFVLANNTTVQNFVDLSNVTLAAIKAGDAAPSGNTITNNGITAGIAAGIQLWSTAGTATNNTISANTISGGAISIDVSSFAPGEVIGGEVIGTDIVGNNASGASDTTIALSGAGTTRNHVWNNTTSGATAVSIEGSDNHIGPGNTLTSVAYAVNISGAKRTVIEGNNAANGGALTGNATGISVNNSLSTPDSGTIIANNDITSNSTSGIELVKVDGVHIVNTIISGSPIAILANDAQNITIGGSTLLATGTDIDPNSAAPFTFTAENTTFGAPTTIPTSAFTLSTQWFQSYRHNGTAGTIQMQGGGMSVAPGQTVNLITNTNTYGGLRNGMNYRPGSVAEVAVSMLDASTTSEAWILTYNATAGNWEVKGSQSGVVGVVTNGSNYTTPTGITIRITEAAPVNDDVISFNVIAPSGDQGTQKILTMKGVSPALNGGRSKLSVDGGIVNLLGTAGAPTRIQGADATTYYDFVVNGGILNADQFSLTQMSTSGLNILAGSTVQSLSNGSFGPTAPGGTHLSFNGVNNTTPANPYTFLTFDASPTFDIAAAGNSQILVCNATRGTGVNNIEVGSSITFCSAPVISSLSVVQRKDGSRIADVALVAADADNDTVSVTQLQYSTDGGASWHDMASPLSGTSFQAVIAGTTVLSEWYVPTNLANTETDTLMVRAVVNDGKVNSPTATISNVSVDTQNPQGLLSLKATNVTTTSIRWLWSQITESHHKEFVIRYGTKKGGPYSKTWGPGNDANLTNGSAVATRVGRLLEATTYYATITATDTFGNSTTFSEGSGATASTATTAIRVHTFQDANANQAKDTNEGDLSGRLVKLYRDNGDGVLTAVDPLQAEARTDSNGNATFTGISAQGYLVDIGIDQNELITTGNIPKFIALVANSTEVVEVGIQSPGQQITMTLESDKLRITADNTDAATITATTRDADNNVLITPLIITFTTDKGKITPAITQTVNGQAVATLTSEQEGIITVTASNNGVSNTIQVEAQAQTQAGVQEIQFAAPNATPTPESVSMARNIAAVTTALLAGLAVLAVLSSLTLAELPLAFMNLITTIMSFFGYKPKRVKWGVVYDSITKKPVKLAVVRLLDPVTLKVVETNITDNNGRFGFILKTGTYTFQVSKAGYRFPSELVSAKVDGKYTNVYDGGPVTIDAESAQKMNVNIPLDSLLVVEALKFYAAKKVLYRAIDILQRINMTVLILGLIGAIILLILDPGALAIGFIIVYIVLILIKLLVIGFYKKAWGVTYNGATGEPLPGTIVEIYNKTTNVKRGVVLSDILGRFKFLPDEGEFFLRPVKKGFQHTDQPIKKKYRNIYKKDEVIVIDELKEAIIDKNIAMGQ